MNEEKILFEWRLFPVEINFVIEKSRGVENRLKYAVQICNLRLTGRFIDNWDKVPIQILNHLSKQLELGLVHNKLASSHKSTDSRIRLVFRISKL